MKQDKQIKKLIKMAVKEDIGAGDVTTKSLTKPKAYVKGSIVAREKAVLCGANVVKDVFKIIDPKIQVSLIRKDKSNVKNGDVVIRLNGPAESILKGERIALNFLSRLSGISTMTNIFVKKTKGTRAKIYDTRKTTPGYRLLEKYAVCTGGGFNHRFGLYDQVLIKDNHYKILDKEAVDNFSAFIGRLRKKLPRRIKIEVEVDSLKILKKVLPARPDIILLDNMRRSDLKRGLEMILRENKKSGRKILSEASGGITLANIGAIARMHVDRISIGAITHSAKAIDFSLELD